MTEREKPIGVFDSGLGGLTALNELKRLLPNENYIYFGDSARIPYGTKSPEVIKKFALQDARFLVSAGVKAIVVACGTVSSNCLPELENAFPLPIIGVVAPSASRASEEAKRSGGSVAVLGTEATIRSGKYEYELKKRGVFEVIPRACPMFVPLVENGHTGIDDIAANAIAAEYLSDIAVKSPCAAILGCTHYPLLSAVIKKYLPETLLIDTGAEAASETARILRDANLLSESFETGSTEFFTSDDVTLFSLGAKRFTNAETGLHIHRTDIETY